MRMAQEPEPVRYRVFSASLREGSLDTRLAGLAVGAVAANGGGVDRPTMSEFDCPSYDGDVEAAGSFPIGARELRRRLESCDAFVIAAVSTMRRCRACSRTPPTGSRASGRGRSTSFTACC